jgi:hypothetical protein
MSSDNIEFEIDVMPIRVPATKRVAKKNTDLSIREQIQNCLGVGDNPDSDDDTILSECSEYSSDNTPIHTARFNFEDSYKTNPQLMKRIGATKREFEAQCDLLEIDGEETYDNQNTTATNGVQTFRNRSKVIQVIVGRTQSGKTGCMLQFIKLYINENIIPIANIYLITGLSSKDWQIQCKGRFPKCLSENIYHNGQMAKFKNDVQGKQNVLILIDEAHMACLKNQTMNSMFKSLNWKLDFMMENDIKLVQFSATPDGILFALNQPKWPRQHFQIHTMDSGAGYFGAPEMVERGNLRQFQNICGRNRKGEWITEPQDIYANIEYVLRALLSFNTPKYILIRVLGGSESYYEDNILHTISSRFSSEEQSLFDTRIKAFCMDGNVENINALLFTVPTKHTIVFIKEKMKCAQTLEHKTQDKHTNVMTIHKIKHNIGVMVERWSKQVEANRSNDSFIIQGLLGRLCGYETHDVICFTNLDSVEKYEALFHTNFDEDLLNTIGWNSNSTRGGISGTKTKFTFNSAEERIGEVSDDESASIEPAEPTIAKFTSQKLAKEYCVDVLKTTGPRSLKVNVDGLYTSTVRSITKVWSVSELYNERKFGLDEHTTKYRFRACYADIRDPTSIQFWVIHY